MNTISDIMFWISTGLLVPVIVLLILLFFRSLLLVGSFFGQYVSIRKTDKLIREQMETLHVNNVDHFAEKLPEKSNSLVVMFMKRILAEQRNKAQVQRLLANFEIAADGILPVGSSCGKLFSGEESYDGGLSLVVLVSGSVDYSGFILWFDTGYILFSRDFI